MVVEMVTNVVIVLVLAIVPVIWYRVQSIEHRV